MRCNKCGFENIEGTLYCAHCMSTLSSQNGEKTSFAKEKITTDKSTNPDEKSIRSPRTNARPSPESASFAEKPVKPSDKRKGSIHADSQPARKSPEPKSKKNGALLKKLKSILAVAVAVVVIASAALVVLSLAGKKEIFCTAELSQLKLYSSEDGKTYIAEGKKLLSESIDGKITGQATSLSESSAYVTGNGSSRTLYFVNSKSVERISSDVGEFMLSLNGESLLYICSVENGMGDLHLYNAKSSEDTVIDKSVSGISAVSPDGKSYIYSYIDSLEIDGEKETHERYRLIVSDVRSELDGIIPIALTDSAEYIYYIKDTNLYARKDNAEMNIGVCEGDFLFSSNMHEVIFLSDNKYYISCRGSEKLKLSDAAVEIALSPDSQINNGTVITEVSSGKPVSNSLTDVRIAPTESFINRIYVSDGSLWVIDKEYSSRKLFGKCSAACEINGSKNVFYLTDDGALGYFRRNRPEDREIISTSVAEYFVTGNGKAVYYLIEANTAANEKLYKLMYAKLGENAVELSKNVTSASISAKDIIYYVTKEADKKSLMCRSAEKEAVLVAESLKKNYTVISDMCGNIFLKESNKSSRSFDLYFVKSKTKLELVISNVS